MTETQFVGGIFDQGDVLPPLIVTTVERVLPGDIYWGCSMDPEAPRKGWKLESEGQVVPQGAMPLDFEVNDAPPRWWTINGYQFRRPDYPVLVQQR